MIIATVIAINAIAKKQQSSISFIVRIYTYDDTGETETTNSSISKLVGVRKKGNLLDDSISAKL